MDSIGAYFVGLDVWGWLEIFAMVAGIYYVYLEIGKSPMLWYVCILTSVLNIFVYWHNNFLSMTVIQFYYIVMAFYGIHAFREIKDDALSEGKEKQASSDKEVLIRRFDWKTGAWTMAIAIPAYFLVANLLKAYADIHGTALFPSQPYWDAFIAVGSMVGTFFLSRSYMCQWYIWIFLDTITVGVFIYSRMYWMALMYVVYIILAFFGIRHWKKYGVYVD